MKILVKRVYAPAAEGDGRRILVDRLWPRGLTKAKVHAEVWARDVAPTDALRKWFAHDPVKWPEFTRRYRAELAANGPAVQALRTAMRGAATVTLLFGAHDEVHNQAMALAAWLRHPRKKDRVEQDCPTLDQAV